MPNMWADSSEPPIKLGPSHTEEDDVPVTPTLSCALPLQRIRNVTEPASFVILSVPRSGTSHIVSLLTRTDGVHCQGEIFHPDVHEHIQPDLLSKLDLSLRERDPKAFVDMVLDHAPAGSTAVGFKIFLNQNRRACEYILANERILKLIVYRSNRLASFASHMKAEVTGIWNEPANLKSDGRYLDYRMSFCPVKFLNYVLEVDRAFSVYQERARGNVLEISYEDLLTRRASTKCAEFLGCGSLVSESAGYRKLNPSNILSRFAESDIPTIVDVLGRIGHLDWAFEGDRNQYGSANERVECVEAALRAYEGGSTPVAAVEKVRHTQDHIETLVKRLYALHDDHKRLSECLNAARVAQAQGEAREHAALQRYIDASSAKADLEAECGRLNNHIWRQDQALNAMLNSRSWRATEPVRKLTTFARGARAKAKALAVRVLPGPVVQWIRRTILRRPV